MSSRPVFVALLATSSLQLLQFTNATAAERDFSFSAAQLTEQVAKRFPMKRCAGALACFRLSDPVVRLVDGDPRIYLQARVDPEFTTGPLPGGRLEMRGEPRYVPAQYAFFADRAELVKMEVPGLPAAYADMIADASRQALTETFSRTPIYTLDDRDQQQALARLVLRGVQVRGGRLVLLLGDRDPAGSAGEGEVFDPGPTRKTPSRTQPPETPIRDREDTDAPYR